MTKCAKSGWPVIGQSVVNSGAVKRTDVIRVGVRIGNGVEHGLVGRSRNRDGAAELQWRLALWHQRSS